MRQNRKRKLSRVVEGRPRVNRKPQPAEAGEWEEFLLRNETHSPVLPTPVFIQRDNFSSMSFLF